MLSVADIPMAGFHFRGIIGIVLLNGREYRLATYLGAKAVRIRTGLVRVTQAEFGRTFCAILDTGEKIPVSRGKYAQLRSEVSEYRTRFI